MVSIRSLINENNSNVSPKELEFRINYNRLDRNSQRIPLCAICCEDLSPALNRAIYPHPVLNVLICTECNNRYRKSNFDSQKLCVCCGLIRKLKSCMKCSSYFCMKCLKSNLDKPMYAKVTESKGWTCLICCSKPLWEQRAICAKLINSVSNQETSVFSLKRKRTLSTNCSEVTKLKRKRSNSWGDKSHHNNDTDSREIITKELKQFASNNRIKKTPSKEDFEEAKNQVLQKADGLLLLTDKVKNSVSEFKEIITSKTFNEQRTLKAFSFENKLIGTTMKTLNLWKNQLHEISERWHKEFNIVLCPPETTAANEGLNNCVTDVVDQTNHDGPKESTTKKSRSKFNLSLRRTSDASLTDEEFENDKDQSKVSAVMSLDVSVENCEDALTNANSSITSENNNQEISNIAKDNVKDDGEDSDDSIFSQETEKILSQDLVPVSEDSNDAIIMTENEEHSATLCDLDGCANSKENGAIMEDDTESERSFVFHLSGYFSEPSPDNEIEENTSVISNDSKKATLGNSNMDNSIRKESLEGNCNSITNDGNAQLDKDFLPDSNAQNETLNASCDEPNINSTEQHSDGAINTSRQTAETDPYCSNGVNEEESQLDDGQGKDNTFSQSEQSDMTPLNSLQSARNEQEKVVEELETKKNFFEALELGCIDELSIDKIDIEEFSLKSYKSSTEEGKSDEHMQDSDTDNPNLKQAFKVFHQDDSDTFFLSDSEVSSSDFELLSESSEDDDVDKFKRVGKIMDKSPDVPLSENYAKDADGSGEELIISASEHSENELKDDNNSEYGIKPCWVFLERPNDASKIMKALATTSNKDEIKEIERLTNINNLDTKRKIEEAGSKNVQKRRKIIKPSGSPDSKSESDKSDSDCDSVIASSLPNNDDADCGRSCGSPESISHNMSLITREDMLDHLINDMADSDLEASGEDSDGNEENNKIRKKKMKRAGSTDSNKENKPVKEEINNDNEKISTDQLNTAEKGNKSWMNDPLLRAKLSETDSDSASDAGVEGENILSEKARLKMEKLEKRMLSSDLLVKPKVENISPSKPKVDSDIDVSLSSEDDMNSTKHAPSNKIVIDTETDSDIEFISETKKKTPSKSRKKKPSCNVSDGTEYETDSNSTGTDTESDSGGKKKGRRNIRAILSDETLEEATKRANLMEKQRKDRLSQKHKDMDSILSQSTFMSQEEGLILDVDDTTNKPSIVVHPKLTERLKKHQQAGVQFMWESCYEGVKQLQKDNGSGCILAHCMGLGKTFQVVALIHTLFAHKITQTNHVLVVCPLSLVLNWKNEFKKGLEGLNDNVVVRTFCLTDHYSTPKQKLFLVDKWHREKGVLIMGYEAYQRLTILQNPEKLTVREKNIKKILVNPGPDLVVLDEGHLLKNGKIIRTKALMQVKTKRRIVLTGTPLQNNLREYYYMVQFVKPNLLGSYHEYTNRFVNPITNGQYDDSTIHDIVQMKKRSHVLHKLLKATLQRYEVSELQSYLPEKYDYVLFIQLHPVQAQLYERYLDLHKAADNKAGLFTNFHKLQIIWTHPYLLYLKEQYKQIQTQNIKNNQDMKNNEEPVTDANPVITENMDIANVWWSTLCPEDYKTNISYGPKFQVMLSIIQECEKVGDKVLVFSNSIIELNAIEFFLQQHEAPNSQWKPKQDFYRMDGSIQPEARLELCNSFNDKNNKRTRVFLISRGVGSLGLNLVAANRVILMDVSWNPAYDSQSVFRTYRFGQEKKCYIYRLVSMGTMEEVVYERQVTKLAIAGRVVDEMQISRHYKSNDLQRMYRFNFNMDQERPPLHVPIDTVLATVLQNRKEIFKYHEHQALLENLPEEELNEDEMKLAWDEFNKESERRLLEQQKKKMPPQPGPSGVNTFLPSHFNNNGAEKNSNNAIQVVPNYNDYIGLDLQPVNQTKNSKFVPNKTKNMIGSNTNAVRFESIFIPDYSRKNFTAENTATIRNKRIQNQNTAGNNLRYSQWVQQQSSAATSTTNVSQDVTNTKSSKNTPSAVPPIARASKGFPRQNKTAISKSTDAASNVSTTPSNTSGKASSIQSSTYTVPIIACVTGGAPAQGTISMGSKITNVTGEFTAQNNNPPPPLVPLIINVTGTSTIQNNNVMVPVVSNVAGAFTTPKDKITMPIITSVTGGSTARINSPTGPKVIEVTSALPVRNSTPTFSNTKHMVQALKHQDGTPKLKKITNVVGASTAKNHGPVFNKIAKAGETLQAQPYKSQNNITLTKISKPSKERRSSMVMNPVSSSNAITLTKQSKSLEAGTHKNVVNIQDEILRNRLLKNTEKVRAKKAMQVEHSKLVRALHKNGDITLSNLGRQPSDTSSGEQNRNNSTLNNNSDVIEID